MIWVQFKLIWTWKQIYYIHNFEERKRDFNTPVISSLKDGLVQSWSSLIISWPPLGGLIQQWGPSSLYEQTTDIKNESKLHINNLGHESPWHIRNEKLVRVVEAKDTGGKGTFTTLLHPCWLDLQYKNTWNNDMQSNNASAKLVHYITTYISRIGQLSLKTKQSNKNFQRIKGLNL